MLQYHVSKLIVEYVVCSDLGPPVEDPFRQLVLNAEEETTDHSELAALAEAAAFAAVNVSSN